MLLTLIIAVVVLTTIVVVYRTNRLSLRKTTFVSLETQFAAAQKALEMIRKEMHFARAAQQPMDELVVEQALQHYDETTKLHLVEEKADDHSH